MAHDKHECCDNGGIVREVAALADRASTLTFHTMNVVDPWTGTTVPIPVMHNGEAFMDAKGLLDQWRLAPTHRKGTARVETLQSFVDLVKRHKDDSSVIFSELRGDHPSLRAIINYHTVEKAPRFGDHSVLYSFPLSPEFLAWKKISGVPLDQRGFAQWIEDHIHEISTAQPEEVDGFEDLLSLKFGSPHELMKVARGITIHADLKVDNIQTLATGEVQVGYAETHTVKGSDNKPLKVPGLIMVSIPLFYGGAMIRVPFRLRYERQGGEVRWRLLAFRLDNILLGALEQDYEVALQETGLPGFRGSPEG